MYEEENTDDLELGDMGDSADEGAEADIHNEGVSLREVLESSNEPIGELTTLAIGLCIHFVLSTRQDQSVRTFHSCQSNGYTCQ